MSSEGLAPAWRRALVLGGIRSGKSAYAEAMLGGVKAVDYVATARRIPGDEGWNARIDAHQARRPAAWRTIEVGEKPLGLMDVLRTATAGQVLLLEDLGTWVAATMEVTVSDELPATLTALGESVAACPARLVAVSPEVGLTVVAASAQVRAFVDALGAANQAVAAACDRVVLVIAGNAVPVKGGL